MATRVEVLEVKDRAHEARWSLLVKVAIVIATGAVGGLIGWGALYQRVDDVAQDVRAVQTAVEDLRRDLNARGQVGP